MQRKGQNMDVGIVFGIGNSATDTALLCHCHFQHPINLSSLYCISLPQPVPVLPAQYQRLQGIDRLSCKSNFADTDADCARLLEPGCTAPSYASLLCEQFPLQLWAKM